MHTFKDFLAEAGKIQPATGKEASVVSLINKLGFSEVESDGNVIVVYTQDSKRVEALQAIQKKLGKGTEHIITTTWSRQGHLSYKSPKGDIIIYAKPTSSKAKKAGGAIDSTKFEGNIVHSLYKQSFNAQKAAAIKKTLGKDINDNDAAIAAADEIAKVLIANIGKIQSASLASGNKISTGLTKLYTKHGVSSTEPKTDMLIVASSGTLRASVKNAKAAQFVSAQANEMSAIYEAALQDVPELGPDQVLTLIQQTMQSQTFYRLRDTIGGRKEDFQNQLNALLGLGGESIDNFNKKVDKVLKNNKIRKSIFADVDKYRPQISDEVAIQYNLDNRLGYDLNPDTQTKTSLRRSLTKIKDEMAEQQKEAMKAMINKSFIGLNQKVTKILSSEKVKKLIIKEGVTGAKKFTNKDAIPNVILKWDAKTPSNSSIGPINAAWLNKAVKSVDIKISDRGSGRGAALRIREAIEEVESEDLSLLSEQIYDNLMMELITEFDLFATLRNAAKHIKDMLSGFVKFVATLIAKVIRIFLSLAKGGAAAISAAAGVWIEERPLIIRDF